MEYRLGFDIDEVINNLNTVLIKYANESCGVDFKYNDIYREYYKDEPTTNKAIGDSFFKAANNYTIQNMTIPMKNSPISILKLKQMGHKIYFISSRPIGNEEHTINWLRMYGFPYDGVYHTGFNISKGIFGKDLNLDFFVDDSVNHLIDLFEIKNYWKLGLVLLNKEWNIDSDISNFPITRCNDWDDIIEHLNMRMNIT